MNERLMAFGNSLLAAQTGHFHMQAAPRIS
jgi:hypothetical protein